MQDSNNTTLLAVLINWCMWKIFYDSVNNEVMYYKKKLQKF